MTLLSPDCTNELLNGKKYDYLEQISHFQDIMNPIIPSLNTINITHYYIVLLSIDLILEHNDAGINNFLNKP